MIRTGVGDDVIDSGDGDDVIQAGTGALAADGGAGIDGLSADLSNATADITLDLRANSYSGPGSIANIEYLSNDISPTDDAFFRTGSGNDRIVTQTIDRRDFIDTGAGNDTVTLVNDDHVIAGTGRDRLIFERPHSTGFVIHAPFGGDFASGYSGGFATPLGHFAGFNGVEDFTIILGDSDDTIGTGDGDDDIDTGGGSDIVSSGAGQDMARGGSGTDRLIVDHADTAGDWHTGTIGGDLAGGYAGSFVNPAMGVVFAEFEHFTITTGSGNDQIATPDDADARRADPRHRGHAEGPAQRHSDWGSPCRCTARSRRSSACCSASIRGSADHRSRTWIWRARQRQ